VNQNKNNFRILVDAEQSYVQKGIESISEQLQERYNQSQAYILPTIQNYLKRSIERAQYEILLAKQRKLVFGAKLVRGAYIVEETRLANEKGYENPVVDCFDKTTDNYLANFEAMVSQFPEGEVIVATHNIDTIESTLAIKKKYCRTPTVSFAQLLGLADHLTWKLKKDNHTVYKYLPWAQTEVMVPYMIRRGQELNQMKYPLDLQYELLKDELWSRIVK
jgi:proline dehydrogenase